MNRRTQTILSIIIPIFLILGTISIYFFAKGYRIDFSKREIERTGVVSIVTSPRRADVYVDGEITGRSPKTIGGLAEGTHTVRVEKDGYYPWEMEVTITAEMLIPLSIQMYLKNPDFETLFEPEIIETCAPADGQSGTDVETPDEITTYSQIGAFYSDPNNTTALFTHFKTTESCIDTTSTPKHILEIWAYPVQRQFWEFNTDLRLIASLTSDDLGPQFETEQPEIDLLISPDGRRTFMTSTFEDATSFYILNTNELNTDIAPASAVTNDGLVSPQWSNDSLHLILSQNEELRSYNVESGTISVITKIDPASKFNWTTNSNGEIFTVRIENDEIALNQITADGDGEIVVTSFASPNGLSNETLNCIKLAPDEDMLFLFGNTEMITYTLDTDAVASYTVDNPTFISFSPEERSFLFLDENDSKLKEFWFDPEETDPLHAIGSRTIIDLDTKYNYSSIRWHPLATSILLIRAEDADSSENTESVIEAIDLESGAEIQFSTLYAPGKISLDTSGEFLIGKCTETSICSIYFEN